MTMSSPHETMTAFPLEQAICVLEALQDCKADAERIQVIREALADGYEYRSISYYLAENFAHILETLPKSATQKLRDRLTYVCKTVTEKLRITYFGVWDGSIHSTPNPYRNQEGRLKVLDRLLELTR